MYKHILIATDGSEIAHKAISHGVELAKKTGAKLSAVTVTEPYEALMELEAPVMMVQADYDKRCAAFATKILSVVTSAAEAAGIQCDARHQQNRWPYEGVIEAAEKVGADLIVLGSHGRRGIAGLLLGSQATKLLTHTKLPTLIVR
jgi:nucleotide-binding universal stress UspA family protein